MARTFEYVPGRGVVPIRSIEAVELAWVRVGPTNPERDMPVLYSTEREPVGEWLPSRERRRRWSRDRRGYLQSRRGSR